ncbi:MAG: hypothetical protein R3F59_13010 [Myxococcota bacterium]
MPTRSWPGCSRAPAGLRPVHPRRRRAGRGPRPFALEVPEAAGQRFLLSNGPPLAMRDIAATVRARLGEAAAKVPTRSIPSVVIRLGALFSAQFRAIAPDLGYAKRTSNARARSVLGWTPRDAHEAVAAAAESLVAMSRAPAG